MRWNWTHPDWPNFGYDSTAVEPFERRFLLSSGEILGAVRHVTGEERDRLRIELLSEEAMRTSAIEGEVLGVVVEVPIDDGHDVLAAYADGSVRYLNHAGSATVIDAPPPEVAQRAAAVLAAGQALADGIGPWTEPALPELPPGHTRLAMLTRGGHRFGQGIDTALVAQPGASELLGAATALLVSVVSL